MPVYCTRSSNIGVFMYSLWAVTYDGHGCHKLLSYDYELFERKTIWSRKTAHTNWGGWGERSSIFCRPTSNQTVRVAVAVVVRALFRFVLSFQKTLLHFCFDGWVVDIRNVGDRARSERCEYEGGRRPPPLHMIEREDDCVIV